MSVHERREPRLAATGGPHYFNRTRGDAFRKAGVIVIAGTPFGMTAFDMETANRFGAPCIAVIGNNSAMNQIRFGQISKYGRSDSVRRRRPKHGISDTPVEHRKIGIFFRIGPRNPVTGTRHQALFSSSQVILNHIRLLARMVVLMNAFLPA